MKVICNCGKELDASADFGLFAFCPECSVTYTISKIPTKVFENKEETACTNTFNSKPRFKI